MRAFIDNSGLLISGTVLALLWANVDHDSYERLAHSLHFVVNDIAMVFFFALAAKEVFEATLPGGSLASPRRALSPLAAAVGGMVAPAVIYVAFASTRGPDELIRGWAIPCATDIAFSAMVARVIYPSTHPAIPFLLLLAIADDALGLMILAVFYPTGTIRPIEFGVLLGLAMAFAYWLKRGRTCSGSTSRTGTASSGTRCSGSSGSATGFRLCEERAGECEFYSDLSDRSCDDVCADGGGTCVAAYGDRDGSPCVRDGTDTCGSTHGDEICVCSRP